MTRYGWVTTVLFVAGCSTFERDWEQAANLASADGAFEGRWEGTWLSDVNAHTGGLRCIVTRREAPAARVEGEEAPGYDARYHATYGCCFSFEYTVPMSVTHQGDTHHFQGSADLGWFAGGEYEYEGEAGPEQFHSIYTSEADHGTFQMARVRSSTAR